MSLNELRVILRDVDRHLHSATDSIDQQQVEILRGIGKVLLVLADLQLSKAEKEA